jgi:hypothetical protein
MAVENRLNHQAFFCSAMSLRSIAAAVNKPLFLPYQIFTALPRWSDLMQASRSFWTSAPRAKSGVPGVLLRMAVMKR